MQAWLRIDPTTREPLFEQLVFRIQEAVARGDLAPEERVPSVRELAASLAINPNTVGRAISELVTRGVLVRRQGTGCFVAAEAEVRTSDADRRALRERLHRICVEARIQGFDSKDLSEVLEQELDELFRGRRSA